MKQIEAVSPVMFEITEGDILKKRESYEALTCDDSQGYQMVRSAIADLRSLRVGIEKRRKELKAGALEYGRKVDAVAKQLTALVEDLEKPLLAKKAAVDEIKEREKRAKEEAERAKIEAEIRAKKEAEERALAEARAQIEAARKELEEQKKAQQMEFEAMRRELAEARKKEEEEKEERERVVREKLAAEREQLRKEREVAEAAKAAAERAEFERQARIKAEREERERVVREAEEEERRKRRLLELRPDKEKLIYVAGEISDLITEIESLEMGTDFGKRAIEHIVSELTTARDYADSRSKFK